MNFSALLKLIGTLFLVYGIVFLLPAAFSFFDGDRFSGVFLACSLGCLLLGGVLVWALRKRKADLDLRTGFALVAMAWIVSGLIGAVPFYASGTVSTVLDAIFESISGFTGTGASILPSVEGVDRGVLLWRSLTQWLGGMGIIVFFVAVLPALGFSGVQLFKAEVAGPQKDRLTPRVKETAQKLWLLYVAFTALLAFLLFHAGMPWFDAINHAFTTLATGGYSTRNAGIASFNSASIDWILSIFMLIGAISFGLHYRFFILRDSSALRDTELRWYGAILSISVATLFFVIWKTQYAAAGDALRHSVFTVASIATSTGFSNQDFLPWPPAAHLIVVLLMVMGGMSGSTAGGLKCIRLVAAFKQMSRQLRQVVHPKAVIPVKANGHVIPEPIIDAIWGLIFTYFLIFSIGSVVLTLDGLDLVTATTATFSALSSIGPGLGTVGPSTSYAHIPDLSKAMLCVCMLLGRLEFFTILVLFTPTFWRR